MWWRPSLYTTLLTVIAWLNLILLLVLTDLVYRPVRRVPVLNLVVQVLLLTLIPLSALAWYHLIRYLTQHSLRKGREGICSRGVR